MKLTIPKDFTGSISDVDGKVYKPDADGTVTIPDEKVTDNLWGYGFVATQAAKQIISDQSKAAN